MSLSREIAAAVDEHVATGGGPGAVSASDGPHRLGLDVEHADRVGLAVLALEFSDGVERSTADLRAWGDRLATRLTYLMEPLVVLEVDPAGVTVELRSQAPTPRGGLRSYYEVLLDRTGTARLRRVAFDDSTRRRRPTTVHLTREVLERLADDLVATAA